MYDIALSVNAFVRSGTRADVAWMISPTISNDALALTPGSGRVGSLASGVFDGNLSDFATRKLPNGRVVALKIGEFESSISGLVAGTDAQFLVVPADSFDPDFWPALMERRPVAITCVLDGDGDDVMAVHVFDAETIDQADEVTAELFAKGVTNVVVQDDLVVTVLFPIPTLVIAGGGPIAHALAAIGELLEWNVSIDGRNTVVAGLVARLSPLDAVVIMGHDVETSSKNLSYALASEAGYIGALGSVKMQEDRADWLAYQEITDLSRVHGPAGLDIQASTPAEIAVSVIAEIIATLKKV